MVFDHFHLREQPFGVTPDPRYLYLSRTHREALASLYYGIDTCRGFMALISEPGMGKTTLLFRLLERLRNSSTIAFLFQTQCDSREMLRYLLSDMGLESHGRDLVELHTQLNQALIGMSRAGRRFVLVIDEAQNLDSSVLETVRLLSDFETPSSKLIQIVLSGQPQLADKLASPSLVQLRQRIAILSRLEPFTSEETNQYIEHRLRIAGHDRGQLFTADAKSVIANQSQGIPRNINNLCFNALSLGCALGRREIDRDIVLEAARDLDVEPLRHTWLCSTDDVPQSPASKRPTTSPAVEKNGLRHRAVYSAAIVSCLVLTCLLLLQPVRRVCRRSLTRARSAVLLMAQTIEPSRHTPQPTGYAAPSAVIDARVGQPSATAAPGGGTRGDGTTSRKVAVAPLPLATTIRFDRIAFPQPTSVASPAPRDTRANWVLGTAPSAAMQTVVVDVQAGRTLSQICVEHYGRFDRELAQRIVALNPQVTDPNHIETGQRIVLPEGVQTSKANNAVRPGNKGPTVAARY